MATRNPNVKDVVDGIKAKAARRLQIMEAREKEWNMASILLFAERRRVVIVARPRPLVFIVTDLRLASDISDIGDTLPEHTHTQQEFATLPDAVAHARALLPDVEPSLAAVLLRRTPWGVVSVVPDADTSAWALSPIGFYPGDSADGFPPHVHGAFHAYDSLEAVFAAVDAMAAPEGDACDCAPPV